MSDFVVLLTVHSVFLSLSSLLVPSVTVELLSQITLVINVPQRTMLLLTVAAAACQDSCGKLIQPGCYKITKLKSPIIRILKYF